MRQWWLLPALICLFLLSPSRPQEPTLLQFGPPESKSLRWSIKMQRSLLKGGRRLSESSLTILDESVRRKDSLLLWETKVVQYLVNGQAVSVAGWSALSSETDRCGRPTKPIQLPSPIPEDLDEWIQDLFSAISLVLPDRPVRFGDRWTYTINVGLKPPQEPRSLKVSYELKKGEVTNKVSSMVISVRCEVPLRLIWRRADGNWTVTGGGAVTGHFWFDPALSILRKRKTQFSFGYTLEREYQAAGEWVQSSQFVNGSVEVEGQVTNL
ncbi:MAG: hypothetical protein NZ959_07490 [Armatimonadetes bacterium]|nr:hypothetical protein [Armatimonadota bacterium]MDW8122218.1 hypothetical protein [Armatimonadota bacterium]